MKNYIRDVGGVIHISDVYYQSEHRYVPSIMTELDDDPESVTCLECLAILNGVAK